MAVIDLHLHSCKMIVITLSYFTGIIMKLSMEQAAHVIGKTKKTIYNHKDSNKFSYEIDEGKTVIDVSELLRVYGSSSDISHRLEELQSNTSKNLSVITPSYTKKKAEKREENQLLEVKMELVKVQSELDKEKALKESAETSVDYFKEALEKSQEGQNRLTLILEDQRTKESGVGEWEKSLKALEQRLANQESASKEIKEREEKILRQNQLLKKALQEERKKGFFKRLFG
ncbi:MAG: hypothetical protein KAJ86_01875 [Alphaproteobacteria bacterium]|nr:hypothetical protein [Alphaproteobacteria bacterium]